MFPVFVYMKKKMKIKIVINFCAAISYLLQVIKCNHLNECQLV